MPKPPVTPRKRPRSAQRGEAARGAGRPAGRKNASTVFREAMRQGFELALKESFMEVLDSVVKAAKSGDMQAAKMLLDRVVPVREDGKPGEGGKVGNIVINVGTVQTDSDGVVIDAYTITEAEGEAVSDDFSENEYQD